MDIVFIDGEVVLCIAGRELFQKKAAIRFLVLWRDEFRCVYCGKSRFEHRITLQVDHLIPQSIGGQYVFENLVTACAECNAGKYNNLLPERLLNKVKEAIKDSSEQFRELTGCIIPHLSDLSGVKAAQSLMPVHDSLDANLKGPDEEVAVEITLSHDMKEGGELSDEYRRAVIEGRLPYDPRVFWQGHGTR